MKAVTKIIFYDDNGEKFFGEGPAVFCVLWRKPVLSAPQP